jgi:hypothetical protein
MEIPKFLGTFPWPNSLYKSEPPESNPSSAVVRPCDLGGQFPQLLGPPFPNFKREVVQLICQSPFQKYQALKYQELGTVDLGD